MSEVQSPTPGTLDGWKEISNYLGKSVRAVQRWERDYGLPVHRIRTPTGQVVYAFKAEIDAWRLVLRERPANDQPEHEAAADPPAEDVETPAATASSDALALPPTVASKHGRRGFLTAVVIAVGVVVLAVGAIILGTKASAVPLTASVYEVSGTSLVALANDRRTVWSHDFGWKPQAIQRFGPELTQTVSADLDGDGHQELLAVIHAPGGNGEPWHESVFCFSDAGALRWSYTPSFRLTYDGREFVGPWRYYARTTSTGTGRQRVWFAFGHHTWWPSFVVELDAVGKATPRYFQSGAVYGLALWTAGSGDYLVASGIDNEYRRASVAVLQVEAPASTSPQHSGSGFHCDSCPQDGPEFFAALQRTELNELSGEPYNFSTAPVANGSDLRVYTEERGFGQSASALYFLRDDFTFHDAGLSDTYWEAHRKLEAQGKISHSFKDCPDRGKPLTPLTWSRSHGWDEATARVAPPPRTLR